MRHGLAVLALLLALLAAAPAQASVSVSSLRVTPSTTLAGAHPNVAIDASFALSPGGYDDGDDVRDISLRLPPGLLGNPRAAPRCSATAFAADACPSNTIVGSTTATATWWCCSITSDGDVYNLVPAAGEPARLGVWLRPFWPLENFRFEAPVRLLPAQGYALQATLTGLPRDVSGFSIRLDAVTLTLFGQAANGPFMTNPTSCLAQPLSVGATSYAAPSTTNWRTVSYTATGCGSLPFSGGLGVAPDTARTDTPAGAAVAVRVDGTESPRRNAHVRRAEIALPHGMTINPALASGLAACSDAQLGTGSSGPPACPAASDIGDVTLDTPLLGALAGQVYFGTPAANDPWRLLVAVPLPGAWLKLTGSVRLDPGDGRVTAVFGQLPQLPFTTLELRLRGGSRGVLVTPAGCGEHTAAARLEPWARLTDPTPLDATPAAVFATSYDGAGAPCPDPPPFTPALSVSASTAQAAASPALTVRVTRPDRQQRLDRLTVALPPGLIGRPNLPGLVPCTDAHANCAAESRLGTASVEVGPGATPVALGGDVFLAEPRAGELAGLLIRVPGRIGPVDLGDVVVRAGLRLRPDDLGVDVVTDPLPAMLAGVPLAIRTLSLTLDRAGFLRNPSSCGEKTVRATFTGGAGATATDQAPYAVTGCGDAPFTAQLGAELETSRSDTPAGARLTLTTAGADVRRAEVALPAGMTLNPALAADLATCDDARLATTPPACPAASEVGAVRLDTPLGALSGPVYFAGTWRLVAAVPLPGLWIKLPVQIRLGDDGRISAVIEQLPELPIDALELSLRGGPRAVLVTPEQCGVHTLRATLAPWTGAADVTAATDVATSYDGAGAPCPERAPFAPSFTLAASTTAAGASPTLTLRVERADRDARLQSLTAALPPGLLGNLQLPGLARCNDAAACPEASRVGTVTLSVGPGEQPLPLTGAVFLADPEPGELAGLLIRVAAPLGLGDVVVRAGLRLRADDLGLDVQTAELPAFHAGVPLAVRTLELALDREGLLLNPTACAPAVVRVTLHGAGDASAAAEAPYAVTACDALPFAPRLHASATTTGSGGPVALTAGVDLGAGEAAIERAAITLPPAIGANLAALAPGPAARIGSAQAVSPLLPLPLSGPVLLAPGAGALPDIAVELNGPVPIRLRGRVEVADGAIRQVFDGLPDLPLSSFELALDGGPGAVLRAAGDLCAAPLEATGEFAAHSGAQSTASAPLRVTGCRRSGPHATATLRRGTLRVRIRAGSAALARVRVTLPRWLRRASGRPRRVSVTAGGRRVKRVARRGTALTATMPAARDIRVTWTGLAPVRGRSHRPPLLVTTTDAAGAVDALRVKIRPPGAAARP